MAKVLAITKPATSTATAAKVPRNSSNCRRSRTASATASSRMAARSRTTTFGPTVARTRSASAARSAPGRAATMIRS
ncbi:hypothetical protein B0E53_04805 [Micromonospora sp. MH33]|nr:hypothetical protein B0E53_04805 [Micromonospora sp. MH33]